MHAAGLPLPAHAVRHAWHLLVCDSLHCPTNTAGEHARARSPPPRRVEATVAVRHRRRQAARQHLCCIRRGQAGGESELPAVESDHAAAQQGQLLLPAGHVGAPLGGADGAAARLEQGLHRRQAALALGRVVQQAGLQSMNEEVVMGSGRGGRGGGELRSRLRGKPSGVAAASARRAQPGCVISCNSFANLDVGNLYEIQQLLLDLCRTEQMARRKGGVRSCTRRDP